MSRTFVIYSKTNRPKKPLLPPEMTGEYINYEIHQKVNKYSDDPDDFEIIDEVVEVKTNIDKYINSFKNEVGVENVLKKVALTQDLNLLNQREAIHMDTTIIPDNPEEAFKLATSVQEAYSKLDPELTGGLSIEEFTKNLTPEMLQKYIDAQVAKKLKEKDSDESNK